MTRNLSILIPAHNEAAYLPSCLNALLASQPGACRVEVIVVANGCSDDTAAVARAHTGDFAARGWSIQVLELSEGNKLNAWNRGEAQAGGEVLVYIDADVRVSPRLIAQLAQVLDTASPRYASGSANVTTAGNWVTRHYTRFWKTTPFMTHGVQGFGVFAMNRAGRARWGEWPDIISDDTFARLHFRPSERHAVAAGYDWPMIEGFGPLVRVRRRQDIGVAEIVARYPALLANDDVKDRTVPIWRRALRDPRAALVFAAVRATIHLPVLRNSGRWVRGR